MSVIIAIILARTGVLKDFLFASQGAEILGAFLAGIFFTSLLTVAPATVVLAELAQKQPLWQLSLVGGLGALLGDYIIFQFIKDRLSGHLHDYLNRGRSRRFLALFRLGIWRWIMFALGALVIASPLPDEVGLMMMGLTRVKTSYFVFLSFTLNALGILAVGLVARI